MMKAVLAYYNDSTTPASVNSVGNSVTVNPIQNASDIDRIRVVPTTRKDGSLDIAMWLTDSLMVKSVRKNIFILSSLFYLLGLSPSEWRFEARWLLLLARWRC